jgi:putative radical SAM enzyme (TIGR03279 family)
VSGGLVSAVEPGSPADALGIQPGDAVLSINGHPLRDLIDYEFYGAAERVSMVVQRDGQDLSLIGRFGGASLGLTFTEVTFDGPIRRCANDCPFCFVKQVPPGLRRTLYIKDDDYRYSFLFGNFVTLTNLSEDDWRRIEEQRLSPLYVSVHATDPAVRARILRHSADILADLDRLRRIGVQLHTQVVTVPGVNDGAVLDRTIGDLSALPHVLSIAAVPVGLNDRGIMVEAKRQSRHRSTADLNLSIPLRSFTRDQARAVVGQMRGWQRRFRRARGRSFAYLGDEFYLLAELPIPGRRHYDGFPQLEDGIGLTRLLLDDAARLKRRLPRLYLRGRAATLACGELIAPVLTQLAAEVNELAGCGLRVLPVPNDFFGRTITVSGLLTGADVARAVEAAGPAVPGPLFLPQSMLSQRYGNFLDDMTPDELAARLGRPVLFSQQLSTVARLLVEGGETRDTLAQEAILAGRHASRNDK